MRYAFDSCGRRVVDYGMGYVPAGGLGVTLNQATINQATARVMNEGQELAIAPPTCPSGSRSFAAGQQIALQACRTGYARSAVTVLSNGTRCVPPCVPVVSKANGANVRACVNEVLSKEEPRSMSPAGEAAMKKCSADHCFSSLYPQADYDCFKYPNGTYNCCD